MTDNDQSAAALQQRAITVQGERVLCVLRDPNAETSPGSGPTKRRRRPHVISALDEYGTETLLCEVPAGETVIRLTDAQLADLYRKRRGKK